MKDNKLFILITAFVWTFILFHQNVNAQQNLAQEAYAIFEQSCLICHGKNGSFSDDLLIEYTALIDDGKVIPGDPEGSVFYQRLIETNVAKRMPQGQPPLALEAIETIRQWILAGAPDWDAIPKPETDFITTDTVLQTIENHVNSLSSSDKSFARYFTLTHLYNAGETTEALNAYRRALSKLINSLSWGREVVKPQPIDAEQTVYYIDLRDYEWDVRNDAWTQIEQAYPYKMTFDSQTQTHLREKLTTLQQEMNCEVPFVHIDWFLANASLPPLYHDILALPETDRELEAALEVFVTENLQNAPGKRVWRAGFNDSRVSRHNRILERHISRYGAYWKSYDFAGSSEAQNIFSHPLDFSQDGGEIIFNLPNGLQAYLIVDREGTRIDAAPISIVSNPAVADPTVRTGLSCIGCHTKGMQTFEDEVRAVVEQADNPPFNKDRALDLYVEKTEMDELVAEDIERFRTALEKTGGVFGGIEPVQRLHEAFQAPLSAAHAASAVGLETETFLEKIRENVGLQNLLGILTVENGTIKRDAWTSNYDTVISALNTPDSVVPPVVERPERIPGAGVYIPDVNLRAAIEEALDKAPGSEITLDDMARLGSFVANNKDIKDLTGLEAAARLDSFSAWGNPISDISPLAGLRHLRSLDISITHVSDLKPLVSLTKLETLLLNGNGISDVLPLSGLVSLTHLNLKENLISDISPLVKLTRLKKLELQDNLISDISSLAKLSQLNWLGLQHNFISDFSPLEALLESTSIVSHDNPGFSGGPKIEGPWLWVTVPGELDDEDRAHLSTKDLLAAASNNQVTEQEVATNGVTEGEVVGDSTWTAGRIDGEDEDNINTMLRGIGLNPPQYPTFVVYGSTTLYSPQEQNINMFIGSDKATKVWLNGELIRKHGGHYFDHGYHTFFPVKLKTGKNVLLVAIDNNNGDNWSGYFGFEEGTEYTVSPSLNVHIPDPNLRSVIEEALDKVSGDVITAEDMETLIHLNSVDASIQDLTGLQLATNLESFVVRWSFDGLLSDLSPLAGLTNLKRLSVSGKSITDLSPFVGLINIEELVLFSTTVSDLSPLADLRKMKRLYFNHAPVSDLSPLAGLTNLEKLEIFYAESPSLAPLKGLVELKKLSVGRSGISDISPLAGLVNLEELELFDNNQIADVSPLASLRNLRRLNLHRNKISDVSPLASLHDLVWIDIAFNNISDISPLEGLPKNLNIIWHENPGFPVGGPKIEGPWLWAMVSGPELDSSTDFLAQASRGDVTELQIATYGAVEGKTVGESTWTPHKITPSGENNIGELMDTLGWSIGDETVGYILYGSIKLYSPREQQTEIFVGADDGVKVWLNGEFIHKKFGERWDPTAINYQSNISVTLNEGVNVLLVAIDNRWGNWSGFFGFDEGTEYTVLPPSEVDIPDPNLRTVIAEALGKEDANSVPITLEEMATLTILRASNRDIKDLTGIAFAVNLEELWISENPISDLSPLVGLTNLIGLGAWDTPTISDLSPLTKLPKLKWVDFGSFPAPDLSPLADIKSLRRLTFHDGGIKDISQLAGFTGLTILDIAYNSTTDLSPITKLTNLEKFVANTNGISDITPLAALTNLKHLDIHGNKISDVSPLAKLVNLEVVKLYNNSISDISPLENSPIFPNVFWLENPGSAMSGPRIEGPWTWLKLPAEHFDADWLAEASGGAVTEQQVAIYSATDGQHVGDNVWKSAKIEQEGTNILEMLSLVGKEHRRTYPGKPPLIYSTIVLNSPREQKTKILEGSEDVSVKIWLNGDLVHKAVRTHSGARLYDRFSPVTLKEGANVLLVAILNLNERHYRLCSIGFDEGTEYTLVPPGVGFSFSATETTNLLAGDTFTLNLNAENITDLAGWQGDVTFDPDALEAVEVTEGDFLKAESENTFFQAGTIDNTAGKITSLYSARIAESGVSGTGTLLSVTFKAKVGGETHVTLGNFEFSSITGDIIPAVPPNITITVGEYPAWDVNQDGRVSIVDLVLVAKDLGSDTPGNLRTDVNRDGVINIQDLILVAQNFGASADSATASPLLTRDNKELMPAMVQAWIDQAFAENDGSIAFQRGIENLQKLLESLTPEKTALLANYPNPFNPETWIPYHLAKSADVFLTIHTADGAVVRTLALGHQNAGMYQSRSRAAHWDGKNALGESVASGVYFYTLTAGRIFCYTQDVNNEVA